LNVKHYVIVLNDKLDSFFYTKQTFKKKLAIRCNHLQRLQYFGSSLLVRY